MAAGSSTGTSELLDNGKQKNNAMYYRRQVSPNGLHAERKPLRVFTDSHAAYSEIFRPASEDTTAAAIQSIIRRHKKADRPIETIWTPGHTGVPWGNTAAHAAAASADGLQRKAIIEGAHTKELTVASKEPPNVSEDIYDFFLEGPLPVAFKDALEKYPVVPITDVKIVLIVAYYRSGSSFFGELMSSTPRTFFHYEPLMLFTVAGNIRLGRQHYAFKLLDALVQVPFRAALHCLDGETPLITSRTTSWLISAEEKSRAFLQVQSWIKRNPEIAPSVRVIHLVRDPRAVYASRRRLGWCKNHKQCGSATALCDQMRSNLDAFGDLGHHLPNNRTYQIRYEDLTADPLNETKRLFASLGLQFTPSVYEYVVNHTTASGAKTKDAFSTWRNAKEVADRWKRRISPRKDSPDTSQVH
ncbi:hypothetical protein HPB51_024775 [Rhipicephalus microplus]|uniref:Uncharacterized protein n=1 Tax=Rhipicephalus microplus TaxID=6941 RepID=A0A9J6D7P2_RHIMP|nr:hypothetical protein HPB51_024775 [Rhipicephalus microplus]